MATTGALRAPASRPEPPGGGWLRFAGNIAGEGTAARRAWRSHYVRRAVLFDVLCATGAAVLGHFFWFSWADLEAGPPPPLWIVALVPLSWIPAMVVARSYEQRFLWTGVEEYRRVLAAAVVMLAAVGTASWAWKLEIARGLVVVAIPLTA